MNTKDAIITVHKDELGAINISTLEMNKFGSLTCVYYHLPNFGIEIQLIVSENLTIYVKNLCLYLEVFIVIKNSPKTKAIIIRVLPC